MIDEPLTPDAIAFQIFEQINSHAEEGWETAGYVAVLHYRKEGGESEGIIYHGGIYNALGLLHHGIERIESEWGMAEEVGE